MINKPDKIVLHHSAVSRNDAYNQTEAINQYHKDKWNFVSSLGFYGGYHWTIQPDGTCHQYRADHDEGAHCIGHNLDSIGICLQGDFNIEEPTLIQVTMLKKLVNQYNLPVMLHRELQSGRDCPGKYVDRNWLNDKIFGINNPIEDEKKKAELEAKIRELQLLQLSLLQKLLSRLKELLGTK